MIRRVKSPTFGPCGTDYPEIGVKKPEIGLGPGGVISIHSAMTPAITGPLAGPIILVDDEPLDLEMLQLLLHQSRLGHPVETYPDAREAWASLQSPVRGDRLPVLILTDLNMPVVDGVEFVRRVRSDPRFSSVAVLVLSGSDRRSEVERVRLAGATGFLLKFPCATVLADLVLRARDGSLGPDFVVSTRPG